MASQTTQTIFGVDIVKGSSRSREAPRYAVVILNGSVDKYSSVSRFKLLRLIKQYRPGILAVDSITELAENRKELVNLLKRLPPDVKLVQVTGNERQEPLTKLARDVGISFNPTIPEEEAFAAACLASMGVGFIVSVFEDKTLIKVSRGRSLGRGGWSQNRYRRKVQGKVREKVREIEAKLKDKVYDLDITEGFGGYVNGTFTVNARRPELGIRNSREEDVQVTVTSVEKDTIEFIPLLEKRKRDYIIVGVDPGTTTAVAILDLNGKLVEASSSRVSSIPEIIEHISEMGRPVVIATDVVPAPAAVEKIKRAFKAVLFSPNERISVEEKVRLARPFGYANDHERDAVAAAVKAFNAYKNKFARIDKKTPSHLSDDVKAMALKNKPIEVALDMLTAPPAVSKKPPEPPREEDARLEELRARVKKKDEQVSNLRSFVNDLRRELKHLELKVTAQERAIERLKSKGLNDVRRTREITIRDGEISRLKKEVSDLKKRNSELQSQMDRLKHIRALELRGDRSPVKVIDSLSKDAIVDCDKKFGIKAGDVIFVRDAGGGAEAAAILIEKNVRALIRGTPMSHLAENKFLEARVPVLSREDVPLKFVDGYAVVDPGRLEAAIDGWKAYASEVEKKRKEEHLLGIIDEYKAKRAREYRRAAQ